MSANPELQKKLRSYIKECGSQNKAAALICKSTAAISTYLSNSYAGNLEKFESYLEEVFKNKEAAENLESATAQNEYKPTSISSKVYETIRLCHLKGGLAIERGDAGIGKTMACKKYAEDYPATAIYVSVNPCLVTLNAFLKLLCRAQKITASGRKDEMWLRLADSFEGERKVLIIDEAQHLPIKTIEAIRAFFDSNPLLGICFVGNIETVTNKGKGKEAFAQILNRTKFTEARHTSAIKSSDIELLFPAVKSDERAISFLLGVARSEQGIRGASNVFGNAVDNRNITYEGLLAMAKAMKLKVF
jgi:DNA transposition AAA+ family ATPase